jgi:hypothetical protein
MKIKVLFLLMLLFQFAELAGQKPFAISHIIDGDDNDPKYKKIESKNLKPDRIIELKVANDMTFFTDQYFSSGIDLKVYAPFMAKSPFSKILLNHHNDALNYYSLTITHNLYTPIYIDTVSHRMVDHPFAAYVLFGDRKESFHEQLRYKVTSELQLGLIGPLAGGQVFQNTLHEYIPIAGPVHGWEDQIDNDLCLQYTAILEKGLLDAHWLELNASASGKLGIPHTEGQLGMYFRVGWFDDYFSHIGIIKNKSWQIWLFCAGDVSYVAYNAVLEGGLFNHENTSALHTINNFLWHTRFGGTLVYKTLKFEIAQEVVSPSFPTALWHRWAYVSLMFGF